MTLPGGDYAERFWSKVDRTGDGCWEWQASRTSHGYGQVSTFRRPRGAHRVAWELVNGPIPDGLWVLHHCDNPPCVRSDHLFLGTVGDNSRDMAAKGRTHVIYGEASRHHKLTQDQVHEMRRLNREGIGYRRLAKMFGLATVNVWRICTNRAWAE